MIELILEQTASAAPPPAGAAGQAQDPREPAGQALASEFADDKDLAEIIAAFVSHLPQRYQAMGEALDNNDRPALVRLAHQMKGAGGSYGYPALTTGGAQLEAAAKAADREACRLHLAHLRALCQAAARGLPTPETAQEHAQ